MMMFDSCSRFLGCPFAFLKPVLVVFLEKERGIGTAVHHVAQEFG